MDANSASQIDNSAALARVRRAAGDVLAHIQAGGRGTMVLHVDSIGSSVAT